MRIAVTAQGQDPSAPVVPRFGRAKFFVVVDTETGEFSTADNTQNLNAAQGAGIQAGRNVVELGANPLRKVRIMPGLDGTGPRGMGPMTGRGRGVCVLKMPAGPAEPVTGIAGRAAVPVSVHLRPQAELASLRSQARQVEAILRPIRQRIEQLQAILTREPIGA